MYTRNTVCFKTEACIWALFGYDTVSGGGVVEDGAVG
jgi:hypothetical protein